MRMVSWLKRLLLASALAGATLAPAEAAVVEVVPETIYEWVQSSARVNYFFNRQEIQYEVDDKGIINLQVLLVPILKTYDAVQIEDVLDKRRWRDMTTDGFEDLAGEANYVRIDLEKQQVMVKEIHLLDSRLWALEKTAPAEVLQLSELTPQNLHRVFYQKIMEYAAKHQTELIERSKGTLSEEDQKRLEKERKEREKQLEKERRAAEKEARERAKAEKKRKR